MKFGLKSVTGQVEAVSFLRDAAKCVCLGQGQGHLLLTGPSGLGKTTLAEAFADDIGSTCFSVLASTCGGFVGLTQIMVRMQAKDVLFIDEIHELSKEDQLKLFLALEGKPFAIKDPKTKVERFITLPKVVFIGATTHRNHLLTAFANRFKFSIMLTSYTQEELTQIACDVACREHDLNLAATQSSFEVACLLARLCHGVPREIKSLLSLIMVRAISENGLSVRPQHITPRLVGDVLKRQHIDPLVGFDKESREYLAALETRTKGASSQTLANLINVEGATVEKKIEPYLLRPITMQYTRVSGGGQERVTSTGPFIEKQASGRVLTDLGREYVKCCRSAQAAGWFQGECLEY